MTRANNFDALRILAASAVIFGHAHPLSASPDVLLLGESVQSVAVKIFFVISGYLVAKSWLYDPNFLRFIARRALRVFPGLMLLLALTTFVLGPLFTALPASDYFRSIDTWMYLGKNFLLYPVYALPGVFAANPYPVAVNGSLWSLPVEFAMYLFLPLIAVITRLIRSRIAFVTLMLVLAVLLFLSLIFFPAESQLVVWGSGSRSFANVAPFFLIGSTFAMSRSQRWIRLDWAIFFIFVVGLLQPSGYWVMQFFLMLILPYATLAFCLCKTPGLSGAGRYGDPSYGIYLYGFPIQQALFSIFGPQMGVWANALLSFPIVLLLAFISWHFVEKYALKIKPRGPNSLLTK
ncbi:acyltransferase [Xanthomonas sp. WHRI 10064A]|uniref:acyltransferase family protein n=1 Tax=unclassified Xanthomonas TaxID=2643310 RepID=UPI002B22B1D6|nr:MULTISPECIES: acyltransferase [unclassified Xanthomonas]MEA9587223.1 acyltransferase [Xanthomonas sp. WHRI 10064B]MEA9616414.1 acyltransferase [Xanthomonas sp. WHRI 10064A]